MLDIIYGTTIIVLFLLLTWSYERRLVTAETLLRQALDLQPAQPQVCGASNGELTCTLEPHETELHLDATRGTQYSSATFRLPRFDAVFDEAFKLREVPDNDVYDQALDAPIAYVPTGWEKSSFNQDEW